MKSKGGIKKKSPKKSKKSDTSPLQAKMVLLFFGIGPLLFMGWFLFDKGFFQ